MRPVIRNLIGLAGFLLLWEGVSQSGMVTRTSLPPPSEVSVRLVELLGQASFLRDVIATVLAWLIALLIAIAIAVPAGLLLGSLPWLRSSTRALIEFIRPIPPVALIPLIIITIGSGPEAKITLAVLAAVWPILFNIIYALDDIDPLLLDTARSLGHRRTRVLATVALPHVAPFAFTGIRLSAAIALIVTVSTEYLAGSEIGVGAFIIDVYTTVNGMDEVLAGTIVIGIIGYLVNEGLERTGRRLFHWSDTTRVEALT
ncbi:ABC transporter permease [Actinophytocola algeriensis]|uniref:NitT/TauT family transport system permease protein n=1 Tax=Actinophytocola algeriensis TaxID=1768010 RepID=A0A7W7Q1D6_9PSEU|nr:ABC transporter permease subunit [Actinophytocola algeriensis]MBB4905051.1 NitT/TauT family transport system permease protein [Actinophytocola algeriensis]MBE1476089.1 NitT/TauT family transport system permease protein [Actinophytocola algeriensis]